MTNEDISLYKGLLEEDAAKFLGYRTRTMEKWRRNGSGPRFVRVNRSVRYRMKDLIDFQEKNVRENNAQQ